MRPFFSFEYCEFGLNGTGQYGYFCGFDDGKFGINGTSEYGYRKDFFVLFGFQHCGFGIGFSDKNEYDYRLSFFSFGA